jgi:hypothetical protein
MKTYAYSSIFISLIISFIFSSCCCGAESNYLKTFIDKILECRVGIPHTSGIKAEGRSDVHQALTTMSASAPDAASYSSGKRQKSSAPTPWRQFKDKMSRYGWGVVVFILLWKFLQKWIKRGTYLAGRWLYSRVAGKCIARSIALRTYHNRIIERYEKLKITFRPYQLRKMEDIFVPLRLKEVNSGDEIDAFEAIKNHKTIMITGLPGGGKSLLLRNCALLSSYGRPVVPDSPVAIFVKFDRLSHSRLSLEEHIVEEFKRNDFPHARKFVHESLVQGHLTILLDGFDEIHSKKRNQIAQKVKDLIAQYSTCAIVVTCRSTVYQREFDDIMKKIYDIAPLSDKQIRQFLNSWIGDMPASKTIEHLISTLQERPHILTLARNPLLLTLIAYLYTDTPYALPHTRAEFYQSSTDLLLRQWDQRNHFEAHDKKLILQQLALANQDRAGEVSFSHRSIDSEIVLEEINNVLIYLNLNSEYARPVLDEIIDRSGLIIEIDEGRCYQFAHITLQEFFSASALLSDEQGLITRFCSNSEIWKEPVKLWCGLSDSSTELIKIVYQHDTLTAFECICDAQNVDNIVTDEIVKTCTSLFCNTKDKSSSIVRAFGAFSSDTGAQEQAVFTFLVESLRQTSNSALRLTAAEALSYTNLQGAARWLTLLLYCSDNDFTEEEQKQLRSSLIRMGDLAVSVLAPLAEFGELFHSDDITQMARLVRDREEVFDALLTIATPRAAYALLPFLWYHDASLAFEAAWRLAALLSDNSIEKSLRTVPLTSDLRRSYQIQWVWEPFNEPLNSSLPVIAGRIYSLIANSLPQKITHIKAHLDVRILIPLFIGLQKDLDFTPSWNEQETPTPELLDSVETLTAQSMEIHIGDIESDDSTLRLQAIKTAFKVLDNYEPKSESDSLPQYLVQELLQFVNSPVPQLMSLLKPELRLPVFKCFFNELPPTYRYWRNIFRSCTYEFPKSLHYRLILFLTASLSTLSLEKIDKIFEQSLVLFTKTNILLFYGALSILISWYILWRGKFNTLFHPDILFTITLSPVLFVSRLFTLVIDTQKHISVKKFRKLIKKIKKDVKMLIKIIPFIGFVPTHVYLITVLLATYLSWYGIVGWWLTFGVIMTYLIHKGLKKERACANPLRGIVDKPRWMEHKKRK